MKLFTITCNYNPKDVIADSHLEAAQKYCAKDGALQQPEQEEVDYYYPNIHKFWVQETNANCRWRMRVIEKDVIV